MKIARSMFAIAVGVLLTSAVAAGDRAEPKVKYRVNVISNGASVAVIQLPPGVTVDFASDRIVNKDKAGILISGNATLTAKLGSGEAISINGSEFQLIAD